MCEQLHHQLFPAQLFDNAEKNITKKRSGLLINLLFASGIMSDVLADVVTCDAQNQRIFTLLEQVDKNSQ